MTPTFNVNKLKNSLQSFLISDAKVRLFFESAKENSHFNTFLTFALCHTIFYILIYAIRSFKRLFCSSWVKYLCNDRMCLKEPDSITKWYAII